VYNNEISIYVIILLKLLNLIMYNNNNNNNQGDQIEFQNIKIHSNQNISSSSGNIKSKDS
jgi:hypothetical protein